MYIYIYICDARDMALGSRYIGRARLIRGLRVHAGRTSGNTKIGTYIFDSKLIVGHVELEVVCRKRRRGARLVLFSVARD